MLYPKPLGNHPDTLQRCDELGLRGVSPLFAFALDEHNQSLYPHIAVGTRIGSDTEMICWLMWSFLALAVNIT